MKPGTAAVLALLRARESVTPADAYRELHQMRLAARVKELRAEGWEITTDRSQGFARYRLQLPAGQLEAGL